MYSPASEEAADWKRKNRDMSEKLPWWPGSEEEDDGCWDSSSISSTFTTSCVCEGLGADWACWTALKRRPLICRGGGPPASLHARTHSCSHLQSRAHPSLYVALNGCKHSSEQRGAAPVRTRRPLMALTLPASPAHECEWRFTHASTSTWEKNSKTQPTQGFRDFSRYNLVCYLTKHHVGLSFNDL